MAQAQDLQRLVVSLEARIDKFDKAMNKAAGISTRTTSKIAKDFNRLDAQLSRFGGVSIAGMFAGISVTAIAGHLNRIVKELGKIGDEADKIGITAEQLQQLGFAAKQSGSSVEAMTEALKQFGKRVGEASTGQGDLLKLFEANGIAIRDMHGNVRPLNDLFLEFAELVKNAGSQSERLKIATIGAGKAATDLVSTLELGRQGLKDFGVEAVVSGNVIENDLVKSAQELDDKWAKFFDGAMTRAMGHTMRMVVAVQTLIDAIDRLAGKMPAGMPGPVSGGLRSAPLIGDFLRAWDAFAGTPGGFDPEEFVKAVQQGRDPQRFRNQRFPPPSVVTGKETKEKTIKEQFKDTIDQSEELDRAMREMIQTMDDARSATRGFVGDLVSGLREGLSLTESLSNAFANLADKMIDRLLDQTVDQLLGPAGSAGTGLLGQLLGLSLKDQSRLTPEAPQLPGPTAPIIPVAQKILDTIAGPVKAPSAPPIDLTDAGGTVKAIEEMLDLSPKVPVIPVTGTALPLKQLTRHPAYDQIPQTGFNPAELFDLFGLALKFFGGARAEGGPVSPGRAYTVGEKGPELFMPRTPGIVVPNAGPGGGGGLAVQVIPSKYFDVRVARTAGRLDAGVLNTARRGYPETAARFEKLGTTSR